MENWIGQMAEFIKVIGKMVNNMEKGHLFIIIKLEKEFGKMGNQLNGVKVKYYYQNDILSSF